ncbi:MAG: radical SAM protein, partial [Deltaproteobacteria bacterium]
VGIGAVPREHRRQAAVTITDHLLPAHGMPRSGAAARAILAAHLARRAWRGLRAGEGAIHAARRAVGDAVLLEVTAQTFGVGSIIRGRQGLFPHIFMPEYHGPHFAEAVRRTVMPLRGPNIAYFSLTGACPCHCEYCFAGAGGAKSPDLGDEVVLRVADAIAAQRIPLVNISGGEPLTRYARLLAAVRALSAGCEVRMFTTGIGLTERRLAELQDAGLKGLFVSLDGADREAFDRARGLQGAFDAAVAALRLAASRDVLTFVNCVVSRSAFPDERDVERFLKFVEAIDPRVVVNFLPQLSTGRGTDADSFRAPDECHPVAERIVGAARRLGRPVTMLFGAVDYFMGCVGAGGKLLNIDINGNVTVCISKAAIGNVLEEPFADIYQRFLARCGRLKVGFFCCKVGDEGDGSILGAPASEAALNEFYEEKPDALWQKVLDRHGWLLARLYPAEAPNT